jgi:ribonucleoside-diphosphate reductase alpha chain
MVMGVDFSEGQMRIFNDRYKEGDEQSPFDMWGRTALWVASNEKESDYWFLQFLNLQYMFKFLAGGRINYAAMKEGDVTAHNCFTIAIQEDSVDGIFVGLREWAETMRRGGGVGANFTILRPRGTPVLGVDGTSSGPIPWMVPFTVMANEVINQGGTRRGAAMIILNDDHPDIVEFIQAKQRPHYLEGANLSVGISDKFIQAVKNNKTWDLVWGGEKYYDLSAQLLWKYIVNSIWKSGEPGVVFLDRCNEERNLWYLDSQQITCVNPCSEIPLPDYGACLLGAINLSALCENGTFNYAELRGTIPTAVRFLDNVIDLSYYPLDKYRQHQKSVRQIGLGFTGLADCLIKLGIPYNSIDAVLFVHGAYKILAEESYRASIELAQEKGSFPLLDPDKFIESKFVARLPDSIKNDIQLHGIRNSYLIAQQPSGSGSLLAGVNSGIEPVFSFDTTRVDRTGTWEPESDAARAYSAHIGLGGSDSAVFVTSHGVSPREHINIQAAAQEWCDQAISKTINCSEETTVEEIADVLMYAYDMGLKSVAIYRHKSRDTQVLFKKGEDVDKSEEAMVGCRSGSCDV